MKKNILKIFRNTFEIGETNSLSTNDPNLPLFQVILTLARTIHIGGLESNGSSWLREVVGGIMQSTPHSWPSHTQKYFPQVSDTVGSQKNVASYYVL